MLREWQGATVEAGGDQPDPDSWTDVEVPGKPSVFAGSDAVAYRTTFPDPRGAETEHALLILKGVYAHARVWLNGSFLGEHNAYFEPLKLRLDADLAASNELVVECRRPDDRFGGSFESDDVPEDQAVPGIWWGADVETYGDYHIVDLSAQPRLDDGGARFEVRATVLAETALEDRLTFSVKPEGDRRGRGMMDRAVVQAAAGERTTVEHVIDIRDPVLWWPHDMGEQSRYVVRAKLDEDERTVTTGLCSVAYDQEDGLRVNGKPVTARGVNLVAAQPGDVNRATDVNANLVRMKAHVPEPAVYEAADEAGVLVWQDLPLTGPGPFDVERGRSLAGRVLDTFDHHPSLATIGIHDSPFTLGEGLGSGTLDRLRLRWRMWRAEYERDGADAVAASVPEWLPAMPVIGPPGIDVDATTLSPGWGYGQASDIEWLLERYPDVGTLVADYGAGSYGSESEGSDIPGFDQAIHDRHVEGGHEGSQAYQQSVVETITEALRLHGSDIIIMSGLRDLAGAGMGVMTDNGTPKQAKQTLREAFAPRQAFLAKPEAGTETDLIVRNDVPGAISGSVQWAAGEKSGTADFTLQGNSSGAPTSIQIPQEAETVELDVRLPEGSVSNTYRI